MINRAVYSFWTKPQSKSKELLCGFNSTEAFLDCLHLSVIFSKKWFKEVVMVTDLEGKKIIEKAKIPFDSITTELEDIKVRPRHWAFGKLVACKIQSKPFMHLDNDVIWFKKPPMRVLRAKACFQNFEANDQYHAFYRPQCKEATKDKLDIGIRYDIEIGETIAVNCGIMAFNEIGFLQELYDKALKFIDWHDTKNFPMWDLSSIVFEQMHLYQILLKRNIMPDVLATFFVDDNLAAELGYTHLISNSKRDEEIEKKVKERLKIELNDKT
jgi:hypothetical protein